ncbi:MULTISPECIES: thioesterase domain-containing protein [Corallococcus]|uniref:thioesterase domain-containing protein n=1 Tax=Corallococcus TaxID=83461 RepID=UPI00117E1219|nr:MULTISPECIES: thioesterase domain-containing protein [Corallococcus]NBD13843.1 hypothetical protein [Corallococcus silvisoli]TSC24490.1 hypothetical protein FOF48_25865 [Corallococcus sp. Z5C101001]
MNNPAKTPESLSPVKRQLLEQLLKQKQGVGGQAPLGRAVPPVVPIRVKGHREPFFLVHPILGVIFPYYELSAALQLDRPMFGIQSFEDSGALIPQRTMEDIAAYYVQRLREVQPTGPYFLGGWSFGSMAAYEMARQLTEQGQEVRFLGLFDTWAPGAGTVTTYSRFGYSVARDIWSLASDYVYLREQRTPPKAQGSAETSRSRFAAVPDWVQTRVRGVRSTLREMRAGSSDFQAGAEQTPSLRPLLNAYAMNSAAVFRYKPRPYTGRVTLFRTRADSALHGRDPSWGWGRLAQGGVDVHAIDGNHMTLLKPPHVQSLAAKVKACLEALDART